jgi:hypothetical protein
MEKRDREFVFKKKDLEIDLDDGTRYLVNPEKDVCLYKIPYRPNGDGEEFICIKQKIMEDSFINHISDRIGLDLKV